MDPFKDRSGQRRRRRKLTIAATIGGILLYATFIVGLQGLKNTWGMELVIPVIFLAVICGLLWYQYRDPWRGYTPEPGWTFRAKDPELPSLFSGPLIYPRDAQGRALPKKNISNVLQGEVDGRSVTFFQAVDIAHGRMGFVAIKLSETAPKLVIEPIQLRTGDALSDRYTFASKIPAPIREILAKLPYSLHCYTTGDALVCVANMTPKSWPAYQQDQLKVLLAIAEILDPQPDKQPQTDATMPAITRGVLHTWQPDKPTSDAMANQAQEWLVLRDDTR